MEGAQLGLLPNDLLLLFEDFPQERATAFTGVLRHARSVYFATKEAKINPDNKLTYVYVPGMSPPFDDPLVQLIRQISQYSGNLRSRDNYLDRIIDRCDASCRSLSELRDERVSWQQSGVPPSLYFALVCLNVVFFFAYLLVTANLQYAGYQVFFGLLAGACAILYLVIVDLESEIEGSFTVNTGLNVLEMGTTPIVKPAIDAIERFLSDARLEIRRTGGNPIRDLDRE